MAVPPNAFPSVLLLSQRRCTDARGDTLLTDGPRRFERNAGFTQSLSSLE
jgi:hypothetical protein